MSKKMLVTTGQTDGICTMANEKGISRQRFQRWLDEREVSHSLDYLKVDELAAEQGARIYTVRSFVRQDRPWDEAVNAAGPNTPANSSVRRAGNLYLPIGTIEERQEHIFLNYPDGDGSWDKALAWGKEVKLVPTVPREVFADGEQHPYLNRLLGVNLMYVVATTECTFGSYRRACSVWWHGSEREADMLLHCVGNFSDARVWFAFRKPSVSDLKP